MKFFTREWQEEYSVTKTEEERAAHKERTNKLFAEYRKQFEAVKSRVSMMFWSNYNKNGGFHDAEVRKICVERRKGKNLPRANVIIILEQYGVLYQIKYQTVSKINYDVDFLTPDCNWPMNGHFDLWMYDEFCVIDSEYINHDISFLSGGEISITFKRISVKKLLD